MMLQIGFQIVVGDVFTKQNMNILCIETSSPEGSICLFSYKTKPLILKYKNWTHKLIKKGQSKESHSEILIPYVNEVLTSTKTNVNDINLLMTSLGPGSFTGLRVATNFANSLSFALNIPIISCNSLYLTALPGLEQDLPVLILLNAHKNQNYAAIYKKNNTKIEILLPPCSLSQSELESKIKSPHLCLGDGFDFYKNNFSPPLLKNLIRLKTYSDCPSALNFGLYFSLYFKNFKKTSWKNNKPLYIRSSEAEEKLWKGFLKPIQ